MKKIWSLIFFLLSFSFVQGQNYDIAKAKIFVNQILRDKFKDTNNLRIYLVSDLYNTLLPSENRKLELYSELKDYMSQIEIEKQLYYCNLFSTDYKWTAGSAPFVIISDIEATEIIEKSNVVLIDNKSKRRKCKKKIPIESLIIKTSPPLFFNDNKCLILVSATRGNTLGSSCVYIYRIQPNGLWEEEKVVICSSS